VIACASTTKTGETYFQTIGNEMNQSKVDEEETSELLELAKLINIFLTINTVTATKKAVLVRSGIFLFAHKLSVPCSISTRNGALYFKVNQLTSTTKMHHLECSTRH
jgi:hypothetical protein